MKKIRFHFPVSPVGLCYVIFLCSIRDTPGQPAYANRSRNKQGALFRLSKELQRFRDRWLKVRCTALSIMVDEQRSADTVCAFSLSLKCRSFVSTVLSATFFTMSYAWYTLLFELKTVHLSLPLFYNGPMQPLRLCAHRWPNIT